MHKLYYEYIIPPRKIVLKSETLQLTRVIDQSEWDVKRYAKTPLLGIDSLFILAETGFFTEISCFVDEDATVYFRRKGIRHMVKGWINILYFKNGGHFTTNDELYGTEKW